MYKLIEGVKIAFLQLRIKYKIFLLMIVLVFISDALLFTASYLIYENSVKSKARNYSVDMIGQITKNIDSYFQGIESIALSLAYNPVIQTNTGNTDINSLYDIMQQRTNVENALKLFVLASHNLQIEIFLEGRNNTFYTMFTSVNPDYDYKKDRWYKIAAGTDNLRTVVLNNPQNYFVEGDRKLVHTLVYKIKSMYTQDIIGYILMDIDRNQFDNFFKNSYIDIRSTLVVDDSNNIIYNYPDDFNFGAIRTSIPAGQEWGYFDAKIQDNDYMVIYGTSEYTNWKVINIIPYKAMLKDMSKMSLTFLLIPMVMFIFTVIVSFRFSTFITNPIVRLMKGMERLKSGQFHFSIPVMYEDETGELIRNFNSMTRQIDYLVKKNETTELLKKETELKALQQQINPHFLYNTLELVIGLASENENHKIIDICKNLGSMFRYNLNDKRVVSIDDELNQVKNYISILLERFEGRFTVKYKANSDVLNYKTVKFILQPFVENSIGHGFKNILRGGLLSISIDWEGDRILFTITDNGQGFEKEELADINSKLASYDEAQIDKTSIPHHLGIMNVFLRLKLMYREQCEMTIISEKNNGAEVRILIPPTT